MTNKITIEKAIKEIKEITEHNRTCVIDDYAPISEETSKMAIEALEHREPKPVVKIPYGWECPVCKAFWATYKGNFIDIDFCPNCGQALDWSDEE